MVKELPVSEEQREWLGRTLSLHANAKMAPDVIKLVMPGVRLLEYEDDAAIVTENDIGYDMYVIYQGRVLVVRKGNMIAELETGGFFPGATQALVAWDSRRDGIFASRAMATRPVRISSLIPSGCSILINASTLSTSPVTSIV